MEKNIMFSTPNVILYIMLFVALYLTYNLYQSPVTSKSYLIGIYLYILISILLITFGARMIGEYNLINPQKYWIVMLLFLVVCFGSFSLMLTDDFMTRHIGLGLFIVVMAMLLSITYKHSSNLVQAGIITSCIVFILSSIVYYSSEKTLEKMVSWIPTLTMILFGFIIVELLYILFSNTYAYRNFFDISIIVLFIFYILADTSKVVLTSKNLPCKTHQCINYPWDSLALILDYINVFIRLVGMSNSS